MITTKIGNILNAEENIICHQVNAQGVAGAGLAAQIKRVYPNFLHVYQDMCQSFTFQQMKVNGLVAWYTTLSGQMIASIFGQEFYGYGMQYTDYVALGNGLNAVRETAEMKDLLSVAIPYGIGCGLAGGDWNVVQNIIRDCFKYSPEIDVAIYKLEE